MHQEAIKSCKEKENDLNIKTSLLMTLETQLREQTKVMDQQKQDVMNMKKSLKIQRADNSKMVL